MAYLGLQRSENLKYHRPTFQAKKNFFHDILTSVWKRIGVNSEFHIPILWNWFLECPNSNSSSGIVASTPIPTQWNWGDSTGIPISKFPTLCSPLKRRKRQLETPSSLLFSNFFSFSKGYRVWEILKSESQWNLPNSVESELELQLQFQVWNWNGGSIQFQNSPMELELELTELFQTLIYRLPHRPDANHSPLNHFLSDLSLSPS